MGLPFIRRWRVVQTIILHFISFLVFDFVINVVQFIVIFFVLVQIRIICVSIFVLHRGQRVVSIVRTRSFHSEFLHSGVVQFASRVQVVQEMRRVVQQSCGIITSSGSLVRVHGVIEVLLFRLRIRIRSIMYVCDLPLEVAYSLTIIQQYQYCYSGTDERQYYHHHC